MMSLNGPWKKKLEDNLEETKRIKKLWLEISQITDLYQVRERKEKVWQCQVL